MIKTNYRTVRKKEARRIWEIKTMKMNDNNSIRKGRTKINYKSARRIWEAKAKRKRRPTTTLKRWNKASKKS